MHIAGCERGGSFQITPAAEIVHPFAPFNIKRFIKLYQGREDGITSWFR